MNLILTVTPDGAARIILPPYAAATGFKLTSVELHRDPVPLKDALLTELPRLVFYGYFRFFILKDFFAKTL